MSDTLETVAENSGGSPAGNQLICASLRQRASGPHRDEFVRNYLAAAIERFHDEQNSRQIRHAEIRRLSGAGALRPVSVPAYPRIDDGSRGGFPAIGGTRRPRARWCATGKDSYAATR